MKHQLHYHSHSDESLQLLEKLIELVRLYEQAPNELSSEWTCRCIYAGRNRLYRLSNAHGSYVVKSFGRIAWLRRLYYSTTNSSKARRSFLNALELEHLEIGTPRPIGYAEEVDILGILGASYYATEYIDARVDVQPEMYGYSAPDGFYSALGDFIASLHLAGVQHIDLSPGNILYRRDSEGAYHFWLVDLNRMNFRSYALGKRDSLKGMSRLSSSASVTTFIASAYAKARGWSVQETISRANAYSDDFFATRLLKLSLRYTCRHWGFSAVHFCYLYIRYRLLRFMRAFLSPSSPRAQRLFALEQDLYSRYLAPEDIRRVLERRYGYLRTYPSNSR